MTDTLVAGVRTFLAASTALKATLGTDASWDTWIFQNRLYVIPEGTGKVALVIERAGAWSPSNPHNTLTFPRIKFTYFGDPTRDSDFNLTSHDGQDKIDSSFLVLDSLMHRPFGMDESWGTIRVLGSVRLGEPLYVPVADGDSMSTAVVYYGLQV